MYPEMSQVTNQCMRSSCTLSTSISKTHRKNEMKISMESWILIQWNIVTIKAENFRVLFFHFKCLPYFTKLFLMGIYNQNLNVGFWVTSEIQFSQYILYNVKNFKASVIIYIGTKFVFISNRGIFAPFADLF